MKTKCTFLTIFVLGLSAQLYAQQSEGVSSVLQQYRITVDSDGSESFTLLSPDSAEVAPGDVIEYRVTYTNNLDEGITQLLPIIPIPIGMEYILDSASPMPEGASLSNTGNAFQEQPLTRQVRQPDGTTTEEEVPGREYRRLRWLVPSLDAGEQVILVARVRVIDN